MRALVALSAVCIAGVGQSILLPSAAQGAATTQKLMIPSYFYPGPLWTQMTNGAPQVFLGIANPNSGPGTTADANYANAIRTAVNAGVKVVGYVRTGYFGTTGIATRSGSTTGAAWTTQVHADVDTWYQLYGASGLSGIFFDETQNACGTNDLWVNYYREVNTYTKNGHPGAFTIQNPGAAAAQCYEDSGDTIVMFEGSYASYLNYATPAWELNSTNPNKFWHLVYAAPNETDMVNAMNLGKQRNAGYMYVTPDVLPNPWDTLPTGTYWTNELSQTGSSGGGDTTPPSAPASLRTTSVSATSVSLAWNASTDNVGVTGYNVYKAGVLATTVTGLSATISGLTGNTTYSFTVKAKDAAGNLSASSNTLSVTTPAGGGSSCTTIPGSGAIINYSACATTTTATYKADFATAVSLHHVFINSDNNTATGYQLPSPSVNRLGADYMIENNILYRSLSTGWSWTSTGVSPNMVVSGSTYTWTVPVSALTNHSSTNQAVFNGNTAYTGVVTYTIP